MLGYLVDVVHKALYHTLLLLSGSFLIVEGFLEVFDFELATVDICFEALHCLGLLLENLLQLEQLLLEVLNLLLLGLERGLHLLRPVSQNRLRLLQIADLEFVAIEFFFFDFETFLDLTLGLL